MAAIVLKLCYQGDTRRKQFKHEWIAYSAIIQAITDVFPDLQKYCAKYLDSDGDLCTLCEASFPDFISTSTTGARHNALLKLELIDAVGIMSLPKPLLFQIPTKGFPTVLGQHVQWREFNQEARRGAHVQMRWNSSSMHKTDDALSRCQLSRAQVIKFLGATAACAALPADAAVTEQSLKTAYTRYVPSIEKGRDYWAENLRAAIDKRDWDTIKMACTPKKNKKEQDGPILRIIQPMSLWGTATGKTAKTTALVAAIDDLKDVIADLDNAAKGEQKATGFFSFLGGTSKMDDGKRLAMAEKAYKEGKEVINRYIELSNTDIAFGMAEMDLMD